MTSSTEKTADLLAAVLANLARVVGSITPEQLHDRPAGTCPARLRKGGRGRASEGQRSLGRLVVALLSSRPTCSEHGGDLAPSVSVAASRGHSIRELSLAGSGGTYGGANASQVRSVAVLSRDGGSGQVRSTALARTLPAFSRPRTSSACSSGKVSTTERSRPAAASSSTSRIC